jgi:serine protease AprX
MPKHLLVSLRQGLLCLMALLAATAAAAQTPPPGPSKLDPVLQARSRQLTGRSRVIVQFKGTPDVRVITGQRGVAGRALPSVGAQVADIDNNRLAAIANLPQVAGVVLDRPAFATMDRTGDTVGATLARQEYGLTGQGVGVAVIDSGITPWHDDLYLVGGRDPRIQNRIVHFKDFTGDSFLRRLGWELPSDDYGHGTHVAGIIAGNGFDSGGARTGMAPGARLIGLRVLDGQGLGYISDVIAAIDYAVSVRKTYNIRIINLSVASGVFESYDTDPLAQAAKRAVEAGIVVVAAAGNLGTTEDGTPQVGGITSPGNAPWVLTVGASSHQGTRTRRDDSVGAFSSRGPTWIDGDMKPDIVAPGVGTESLAAANSTLYHTYSDYLLDGTRRTAFKPYLSLTGTSMAAPVVAGTVALMLEANPDLTPNAVKAILQYTAQEREGTSWFAQGAGMLNTLGAIRMADFFEQPQEGLETPGDTIEGEWVAWSQHLFWGNNRIAGGLPLPGSNAWATDVEWGAQATAAGTPVVGGVRVDDTIVWSTHRSGDDTIVWSTNGRDTIVWSTYSDDTIVWSTYTDDDTIVWSTDSRDTIVWSTTYDDTIVWSTSLEDTIVWSTSYDDTIVWSTGSATQTLWSSQPVDNRRRAGVK